MLLERKHGCDLVMHMPMVSVLWHGRVKRAIFPKDVLGQAKF